MFNPFTVTNNLDEIVFANRNKTYGAYQIRKQYNNSVAKALAVVLGALLLIFFLSVFYTPPKPAVMRAAFDKVVTFTETYIQIDLPPEQPASAASSSSSSNSGNMVITADHQVVQHITTAATTATGLGNTSGGLSATNTNLLGGTGLLPGKISWSGPAKQKPIVETAEVMPMFDNGNGGLAEYLQQQISYPKVAIENNVSGIVMVVFEVNENGLVENVMVENGIGFGCDEEAYRVVSNMPKWKPGMQNGQPVTVRLRLPISFSYH